MSKFFRNPIFKCNLDYSMSYFFILVANFFFLFVIILNVFHLDVGEYEATIKFLLFFFIELCILTIARCICISRQESPKNNTLLPQ